MPIPNSIKELIEGSGNYFHAKVARWFESNGWHTVLSPYYMDQAQSKAREIDLVAEKLWPINGMFDRPEGNVVVRLFIECKFISSEAAFWFAPKNDGAATNLVCSLGPFRKDNVYTQKPHYIAKNPSVAKLFTSNNAKTQENEPFYKALNQVLNATVAMRGQLPSHPSVVGGRGHSKRVVLEYPVVVCSSFSKLWMVNFLAESEPTQITENFLFEVQYAFLDRNGKHSDEYFLLDFVDFDKLTTYAAAIDEDAKAAAHLASMK